MVAVSIVPHSTAARSSPAAIFSQHSRAVAPSRGNVWRREAPSAKLRSLVSHDFSSGYTKLATPLQSAPRQQSRRTTGAAYAVPVMARTRASGADEGDRSAPARSPRPSLKGVYASAEQFDADKVRGIQQSRFSPSDSGEGIFAEVTWTPLVSAAQKTLMESFVSPSRLKAVVNRGISVNFADEAR